MAKEFDIPLRLVTPHMKGQRVKDAQFLMAGNSRFQGLATLKDGEIDGDFGLIDSNATKRTKFWLGYPDSAQDGTFGQVLYEYLNPEIGRRLPPEYKERRAARLAAAAVTPGMKALKKAITQIGYKESRDSRSGNINKYGEWYGFNRVPWCAIFESWCFKETGRPSYRYAAVEQIWSDAHAGRNGLHLVSTPQPGDIIDFVLHGDPFAHTAFFEKWINKSAGTFSDVGGNTGPSSISNGGMVARSDRNTNQVHAFIRVG